jgi:predicted acyl esterase
MEDSEPFDVLGRDDLPPISLYESQVIDEGFNYIEVRDGVRLSINVRFPNQAMWGPPPWPTLIEYSGYGPSNPESQEPGSSITLQLGFATVGVNMRGTGCSGGVFDVFNPAQQADGYDVVETIARQPWVLHGKPGMVGLSYSGISQLFVASTRPPHLAAITPLSVIEDPWRQQWPGGVYNSGFTRQWLAERDNQSGSGVGWVRRRIENGDTICQSNQAIRSQNIEFEALGRALEMYPPDEDARRLSLLVPSTFRSTSPVPGKMNRPARCSPTCSMTLRRGTIASSSFSTAAIPTATARP